MKCSRVCCGVTAKRRLRITHYLACPGSAGRHCRWLKHEPDVPDRTDAIYSRKLTALSHVLPTCAVVLLDEAAGTADKCPSLTPLYQKRFGGGAHRKSEG